MSSYTNNVTSILRPRIHRVVLWLCLCLPALCFAEDSEALHHPELFHRLSREVVTPHIRWSGPLPNGPLKALVIGYRWGQRESVELMQRMDIECVPMLVYGPDALFSTTSHWGHEKTPSIKEAFVLRDFRTKLKDEYDVIIISQAAEADWPADIVSSVIAKVRAGTGLVFIRPGDHPRDLLLAIGAAAAPPQTPGLGALVEDDDPGFTDVALEDPKEAALARLSPIALGIPFESIPGTGVSRRIDDLPKLLSMSTCGEGRVVLIRYPGRGLLLTPSQVDDLGYEYALSFVIKAIRWAARDEPLVGFDSFPNMLPPSARNLTFTLRNPGAPQKAALTLAIRSPRNMQSLPEEPEPSPGVSQTRRLLAPLSAVSRRIDVPSGTTSVSLPLPDLPEGDYFADVLLEPQSGTTDWAATRLQRTAQCAITAVRIEPEALNLQAEDAHTITASVDLSGGAPADASIDIAVLDNCNRILDSQRTPLSAGESHAVGALTVSDIETTLLKVRVELIAGSRTLSVGSGTLTAYNRAWDDFTFFAWGGVGRDVVSRARYRMMASLGIDAVRGQVSIDSLKVADIRQVRDILRFSGSVDPATKTVTPCFSSEEFLTRVREACKDAVGTRPMTDCFGYLFGDEFGYANRGGLPAACCSPSCTVRLREYLQASYGTIDALNRQWDSDYDSFDDIVPSSSRDEIMARATKTGNFSPLIDQWLSNYHVFADAVRVCRDAVKQADPVPRVGPSTPLWNWYYRAYDWYAIMQFCDFATPYGPWGDSSNIESIRSFASADTVLSAHYGSYVTPILHDEDHYRMVPYAILFKGGGNAFWYTTWGNEGGFSPWLDPYPCLLRSSESIREIKNGIGRLLHGARRQDDRIAIHYSTPSILFSFLASGPHVPWRINALVATLHQLGLQPVLVSREQILRGDLSGYRALLMPMSQCVGDAEARQIETFVRRGGLVLADARPGIADGHGRIGATPRLSELFGLRWNILTPDQEEPIAPLAPMQMQLAGGYMDRDFTAPPGKLSVDRNVALNGADAVLRKDSVPLVTHRVVEQGTAICLNTLFDRQPHVLKTILAAHGIAPKIEIANTPEGYSPGGWQPGLEFTRFEDGRARYFGLTRRRDPGPDSVSVPLEETMHAYDVRSRAYLGAVDAVSLEIPPSGVRLIACLPYRVRALTAGLDAKTVARGGRIAGTVRLDTTDSAPARHVIHIEALRPDGAAVRYCARNITLIDGTGTFSIPVCLNELAGTWRLELTDAATGIGTELTLDIVP